MVCFLNCLLYVIYVVELLVSSVICGLQGLSYLHVPDCIWVLFDFIYSSQCSFFNYVFVATFWIFTSEKYLLFYKKLFTYFLVTCLEVFWSVMSQLVSACCGQGGLCLAQLSLVVPFWRQVPHDHRLAHSRGLSEPIKPMDQALTWLTLPQKTLIHHSDITITYFGFYLIKSRLPNMPVLLLDCHLPTQYTTHTITLQQWTKKP